MTLPAPTTYNTRMWQSLHDLWWRLATQSHPRSFWDSLAGGALQTCSVAYQAGVRFRNAAYDRGWVRQVKLPCRVVSVGNLTVGGTGKTSCVELVARLFQQQGRRVAILSRGYGGRRRDYWLRSEAGRLLVDGQEVRGLDGLADEPQLLAGHLEGVPVLVGVNRARTGQLACRRFQPDTVVLDDGFQHRCLHRDCDIVLIHARMPLGGWPSLPRGPMREPLTALRRAHVVIVTKVDEAPDTLPAYRERLRALSPDAVVAAAVHEPHDLLEASTAELAPLARLNSLHVGLLSSIGDPQGFEATVRRLEARVSWHQTFPDHHRYRLAEWALLGARARAERLDALVTTEKDWIRLRPLVGGANPIAPVPVWIVRVRMTIVEGADALHDRLARLHAG